MVGWGVGAVDYIDCLLIALGPVHASNIIASLIAIGNIQEILAYINIYEYL